ncbi:MAG: hypothetical protein WD407_01910 [Rhodospirillales bacterium]
MASFGLPTVLSPHTGSFSVLTPFTATESREAVFLNQINGLRSPKILNEQNSIRSTLQRELNQLAADQLKQEDLRKEATDAIKFTSDAISRAKLIRSTIDNAIKIAVQADEGDESSFLALASSFDSYINSIINTANNGPVPNLLGELPQGGYSFRTSTNGARFTINPVFLGTNYTITEDGSGDRFVRVDDSKTLHETDATTGEFTGTFGAIMSGIRLDSFDSSTNAIGITLSPATAGATSITGTLSTSGLGLGNAFVYDNLQTQDGGDGAVAALEAAKIFVDQAMIRLNAAQAQAKLVESKASKRLNSLLLQNDGLVSDAQFDLKIVQAKAESINQLNQNILESQAAFRNELLKLIPVKGLAGKFTSSLLNVFI